MNGPHWLTPGGATWTPPVTVCFDTETRVNVKARGEFLTLRCWDQVTRVRRRSAGDQDLIVESGGEDAPDLADSLEAAAAITGEAWVFAHNAGFDLTVTSLPMILSARGWEPVFVNLGDETCVFSLKRDRLKLTITDSWSWLRCGLDTAAGDVGMRKVRLPGDDDDLEMWHHRCRHDARILDRLMGELLDWWDRHDLGRFAVTGAGCGWRTLRHHIAAETILVGPEEGRTAFEREAIYSGRKEVWQVGRFRNRVVEDWDLRSAHLTVLANELLPARPLDHRKLDPVPDPLNPPYGLGAVCRVKITARRPCAPLRAAGDIWWPVGQFITVLTTVELQEVLKDADQVEVLDQQWYMLTDQLQAWGRWCQGLAEQPDSVVPKVVKRVAKGWGRAVPGRFALRTSRLIRTEPAEHLGWMLETGHDLDTGRALETVTYGGKARTYLKDLDGRDCSPVVLAFVEGYVRAEMARIIRSRPPGNLLQVNTDGWWEIREGRDPDAAGTAVSPPFTGVRKAVTRDVTIIGPNHTDSKDDQRLSGVPANATLNESGAYQWQDWPGLRWQMQFSRPGEYRRPGREMVLHDHYCRRWVLDTGETVPVSSTVTDAGETVLLPWSGTVGREPSDRLAEWQVPVLAELRDDDQPFCGRHGTPAPCQPGRRRSPRP